MALQTFSNLESLLSIRTKINANFTELYASVASLATVVGTGWVTWSGLTVLQTAPTINSPILVTPTLWVARATSIIQWSGANWIFLYNTADETTNFERFITRRNWNTLQMLSGSWGSWSTRTIGIYACNAWGEVIGSTTIGLIISRATGTAFTFQASNSPTQLSNGMQVNIQFTNTISSGISTWLWITWTIAQTGTAWYTGLLVNPTESTTWSGAKALILAQVWGSARLIVTNTLASLIWVGTEAPTHPLTFASTANGWICIYNTGDQTTNFERLVMYWSSNNAILQLQGGGSSSSRSLVISAQTGTWWSATSLTMARGWNGPFILWNLTTAISVWADVVIHRIFSTTTSTNQSTNKTTFVSIEPNIAQSGTAWFTGLLINPTLASQWSWLNLLQDWKAWGTSLAVMTSGGLMWFNTTAPTHSLSFGSTASDIVFYNTVDQVTNYERVRMQRVSNRFDITVWVWGTWSNRIIRIWANSWLDTSWGATNISIEPDNLRYAIRSWSGASLWHVFTTGSNTASSSTQSIISISWIIAHSWTAWYNWLIINITETSLWSGTKNLIVAQVGWVTKFAVDNNWVIKIWNTVASAVAVASTHKVTIDIWGTTYYLLATT